MRKLLNWLIFIGSVVSFLISIKLFWNLGIFVDEYNLSPDKVYGGDFWLYMNWLRIGLLFITSIGSGYNLLKKNRDSRNI